MTTITGPGELVSLVPAILGFSPEDSVVTVLVRERGALGAVLRMDERDLAGDLGFELAHQLARQAMREGTRCALVLAFTSDTATALDALGAAVEALEQTVARVEPWIVTDGRYFSPDCEDPVCCPPGGRPVPDGGRSDPVSARVGRERGRSRATVAARRSMAAAARRWDARRERGMADWRSESARRWERALRCTDPGTAELGALAAALGDVRVRDALLLMLVPGAAQAVRDALDGRDSEAIAATLGSGLRPTAPPVESLTCQARRVLEEVLAHAPATRCAPAAAVLAVIAWWAGEPLAARSWCAIALDHDSEYRLALLLLALMDAEIA